MNISPETRVGELLQTYPQLEATLIEIAPAFEKLKNPILRKTVAKVATLEQAAKIGGLGVRELVCRLREAVGQAPEPPSLNVLQDTSAPKQQPLPEWFDEAKVRFDVDADTMLAVGQHPVGVLRQYAGQLAGGEIVRMRVGFFPAPLIELMRNNGMQVHSEEPRPGQFVIYFCRA
jgi:hypothetical protein